MSTPQVKVGDLGEAPIIPIVLILIGSYLAWFGVHYWRRDIKWPSDPVKSVLQGKGLPPQGNITTSAVILTSAQTAEASASTGTGSGSGGLGPSAGGSVGGKGNVTPLEVYKALRHAGVPRGDAVMLTAIAGVESGYSTLAWNQDANTGDDSVGLFQINYLGSLYAARVQLTGLTPEQLHAADVQTQADAAAKLYGQSGLQPWEPDITSGKVGPFLANAHAASVDAGF